MNMQVFTSVALGIPIGFGLIALVIYLADEVADKINDYLRSKQTYLIPDGKGGYIQLPPGVEYIQVQQDKEKN